MRIKCTAVVDGYLNVSWFASTTYLMIMRRVKVLWILLKPQKRKASSRRMMTSSMSCWPRWDCRSRVLWQPPPGTDNTDTTTSRYRSFHIAVSASEYVVSCLLNQRAGESIPPALLEMLGCRLNLKWFAVHGHSVRSALRLPVCEQ